MKRMKRMKRIKRIKRMVKLCALMVLLACPLRVQAQLAVADGFAHGILAKMGIDQIIYYGQSLAELVQNVQNTYAQIVLLKEAGERSLQNLRSVVDVKSFDDFMKWQNRQLYMEREVADRYRNTGMQIGDKKYTIETLDEIPGALRRNYGDQYWDDFTEEQRREMYVQLGLSPSNYAYVKTWSERTDRLAQRMLFQSEILDDEYEEAAEHRKNLIGKYRSSREDLDSNEILKETHITQMNIEMGLRNLSRILTGKFEYDVAKDKIGSTPANPVMLSDHWDSQPFGNINESYVAVEYF